MDYVIRYKRLQPKTLGFCFPKYEQLLVATRSNPISWSVIASVSQRVISIIKLISSSFS
jgi:hypothetical protein